MPDLRKVLKAWECCKNPFNRICEKCPFEKECCHDGIPDFVVAKSIELLKEQEKPKTGHWIPIKSPTGVEAFGIKEMTVFDVCCSVCGAEEDVSFTGYKYCPRCGTKMEGR